MVYGALFCNECYSYHSCLCGPYHMWETINVHVKTFLEVLCDIMHLYVVSMYNTSIVSMYIDLCTCTCACTYMCVCECVCVCVCVCVWVGGCGKYSQGWEVALVEFSD